MKYAFLIPMGEQMVPQMLFTQWVPFQEWLATNEDGKIFSVCSSNQIVGRNTLITNGNPYDPFEFLKTVEWIISVDADIKSTVMKTNLCSRIQRAHTSTTKNVECLNGVYCQKGFKYD